MPLIQARVLPAGAAEREIIAAIRQVLLGYGSPSWVTPLNDWPDIKGLERRVYQARNRAKALTT